MQENNELTIHIHFLQESCFVHSNAEQEKCEDIDIFTTFARSTFFEKRLNKIQRSRTQVTAILQGRLQMKIRQTFKFGTFWHVHTSFVGNEGVLLFTCEDTTRNWFKNLAIWTFSRSKMKTFTFQMIAVTAAATKSATRPAKMLSRDGLKKLILVVATVQCVANVQLGTPQNDWVLARLTAIIIKFWVSLIQMLILIIMALMWSTVDARVSDDL